jgi:hypothetical protein
VIVMRRCVWSINLVNEKALAHWGLSRQKKKNKKSMIHAADWGGVVVKALRY